MARKVLQGKGQQMAWGRMLGRFVAEDALAQLRVMLPDVTAEFVKRLGRASDQHLLDAGQRGAEFIEEFLLRLRQRLLPARMVRLGLDLLRQHMLGVKAQNLRLVAIRPDDGVGQFHGGMLRGLPDSELVRQFTQCVACGSTIRRAQGNDAALPDYRCRVRRKSSSKTLTWSGCSCCTQ